MKSELLTVEETAQKLLNWDDILIICHKNPDGDTLGTAGALYHAFISMGRNCAVICHDRIPVKYNHLSLNLYDYDFTPKHIISVDVASENLFGDSVEKYAGNVELCIDHHSTNTHYAKFLCLKSGYPAAAQMAYEIINCMNLNITKIIANCIYTGIITDTGCFRYSSTLPSTHLVAAKLMNAGADYTRLSEKFFMSKTKKTVELEKFALNNLEYFFEDRFAFLVIDENIMSDIEPEPTDLDGLSSYAKNFEWVEVSIVLRWVGENLYKGSVRTKETVNATAIANKLGGGGHIRAAGFELNTDIVSAKKAIISRVESEICKATETV